MMNKMDWLWFWLIVAFVGNFTGFSLLKRIPKFKHSFGANEPDWLVNVVWDTALLFVPFMLICNLLLAPQNRNRIKDSLLLNTCLNFICLAFPAVIEHLVEYPKFHINVKDVEQHNSRKKIELFAAFSFASTSFGLAKSYDLAFESGFFSLCLGYAMKVSLEVIYENGNRNLAFILVTYSFCFMVILLRKYLEKNNGSNTTRHNHTLDSTNIANLSPNNNEGADQNMSAASNADLQGRENVPLVTLASDQPRQHEILMPGLNGSRENVSGSQRNLRRESWDINEQHLESLPPRLYNDTSTEDGEEEKDVPSVSNFVVKESRDFIITSPEINNCFVEETSVNNDSVGKIEDSVGKIEEREVPGQGSRNKERDMRSTASSSHGKIVGSIGFGGYEKDDVPLILTRSSNIIDSETEIVNDQMEGKKDQSQESDSQDYEIDDNNALLPKSSLDKDDNDDKDSHHESSNGEESDGDDFHTGGGCKFGVNRRHKDRGQESDSQEQGGDIPGHLSEFNNTEVDLEKMERSVDPQDGINYFEGIRKPFSDEGTSKPSDDLNDNSSDHDGSVGDDFNSGRGCKVRVGQKGRNECLVNEGKDISDLDNLELARQSDLELSTDHCWMHRNFPPILANQLPGAKISKSSDDDNDNSSNGDGSNGDNFNSKAGCKVGVGRRGKNNCLTKEGEDITNSEEFHTPLSSPKMSIPQAMNQKFPSWGKSMSLNSTVADFSVDPGFAERAAKFSCFSSRSFNGRTSQFVMNKSNGEFSQSQRSKSIPLMENGKLSRVSISPSLKALGSQMGTQENKNSPMELANSQEESTLSEQTSNGGTGVKPSPEMNSRKRKAPSKGKVKQTSTSTNSPKALESNEDSNLKQSKPNEGAGNENGSVKAEEESKGDNSNAGEDKQTKSNSKPPEPPKDYIHVRARRGQTTDSHSLAEEVRREKISERMRLPQDLAQGCNKVTGKALMPDEIMNRVQSMKRQVEFLSMKLDSVNTRLDFTVKSLISQDIFPSNNSLAHPIFPPLDSSAPPFYGHQPQQPNPATHNNIHPDLPPINGFNEAAPQYPITFSEDDLNTIVQMGFSQTANRKSPTQSPSFNGGSNNMKVEI